MEIILIILKVMLLVGLLICALIVIRLKRSILEMNEKAKTFQEELRTFIEDLEVAKDLERIEKDNVMGSEL